MQIKVISLNMWLGGLLFPEIIDFLKTENADIVLLQEVYNSEDKHLEDRYRSVEVLKQNLGYGYEDYLLGFMHETPDGTIPQGNAILSRFPITGRTAYTLQEPTLQSYKDIPEHWPVLPRYLQKVDLDVTGKTLSVFNMHGVWDLNGSSYSPARQKMDEVIQKAIAGKQPVILGGDSNANSDNPMIINLSKKLNNVFGQSLKTTFNMKHKTSQGYATAVVDHLFVSNDIKVISSVCPDMDISDHLPLVANLEI